MGSLVGFNDLPHFVRAFTQAMGMSPSKYRKELCEVINERIDTGTLPLKCRR